MERWASLAVLASLKHHQLGIVLVIHLPMVTPGNCEASKHCVPSAGHEFRLLYEIFPKSGVHPCTTQLYWVATRAYLFVESDARELHRELRRSRLWGLSAS